MKQRRKGGSVTIGAEAVETSTPAATSTTTEPASAGSSVSAVGSRRANKALESSPPTEAADAGSATTGVTRDAD